VTPATRDPATSGRIAALVGLLLLLAVLGHLTEFSFSSLVDPANREVAARFLAGFLPPAHDAPFLAEVARACWRTVAMATAGVALAISLALPAALLLTRPLSLSALGRFRRRSGPLQGSARVILRIMLVVLRSVPEVVWALLLVRVVGLGPSAGVLAITITYVGMLGKVYAEIFESAEAAPTLALLRVGAGRLQAFAFGLLPQCSDEMISYSVYRWECAIRSSVVLGFVGAGGLGQMMDQSLRMFAGGEVASLLLVFVLLVAVADLASAILRRLWA
jgi:phosphonate transport system permease protein